MPQIQLFPASSESFPDQVMGLIKCACMIWILFFYSPFLKEHQEIVELLGPS